MYIDTWYDRHTRSYVVQLKDREGNQLGEAEYYGNKDDRDRAVDRIQWQLGAELREQD